MSGNRRMRTATNLMNLLLSQWVSKGDSVVDATVGNGNDTRTLLQLVGSQGRVYGFDIQPQALESTRSALGMEAGDVRLILAGHETMEQHISEPVDLILFNLGYLPGGDKAITTVTETTQLALEASLRLLKPGGLLAVVLYPGHPEGARERDAVLEWGRGLPQQTADVLHMHFINQAKNPPEIVLIERK